ncbi:hypothetical protein PO393_29275, partial [Klebsiella michiganensis]|uniref:hypothetical protein n=1 Tax=Klebsiella michiganensis TaxID=1134687 RepID=UPI00287F6CDC
IRCHRQNMKSSIINGSEVSRLSVAIHITFPAQSMIFLATYKTAGSNTSFAISISLMAPIVIPL